MEEDPFTNGAVPFADISEDSFPFTVRGYDVDTKVMQWEIYVDGPGAIRIPGRPEGVRELGVEVTWADGTVTRTD